MLKPQPIWQKVKKTAVGWLFGIGSVLSVTLTLLVVILLSRPILLTRIHSLLAVLKRMAAGDLTARVDGPVSFDEIGDLQHQVNSMAAKLEARVGLLETSKAASARRLAVVASLSKCLGTIPSPDALLAKVIEQLEESFDYYHIDIYMLEASGENLVVTESTGSAGTEMKANRHSIPLSSPSSLVARAACTGEMATAANVRETKNWLPNPLLPETVC